MFEYLDSDFYKMTEIFVAIIVFASISFFTISNMSQNEHMVNVVDSIFALIIK